MAARFLGCSVSQTSKPLIAAASLPVVMSSTSKSRACVASCADDAQQFQVQQVHFKPYSVATGLHCFTSSFENKTQADTVATTWYRRHPNLPEFLEAACILAQFN